jgi:phage terminase large subunit-like protein
VLHKASEKEPFVYHFGGMGAKAKTTEALEAFRTAVRGEEIKHCGDFRLSSHVLNAKIRINQAGYSIYKEHPNSEHKIDGAIGAVLAYKGYLDTLSKGDYQKESPRTVRQLV